MNALNQQIKEVLDRQQRTKRNAKPNAELQAKPTVTNPLKWQEIQNTQPMQSPIKTISKLERKKMQDVM